MATKVLLGDILISPAPRGRIKFNNPRSIAKIDIPGSAPIHQDMGEEETTIFWDGALIGSNAYSTAIKLESLKDAGLPVQLTISDMPELCKKVRIRSFPWDVTRTDRIDYSIELVAEIPPPLVIVNPPPVPKSDAEVATVLAALGKSYTIKQGDTLWALAVANYGDGTRWREIADANGILDPRKLVIGHAITIPTEAVKA